MGLPVLTFAVFLAFMVGFGGPEDLRAQALEWTLPGLPLAVPKVLFHGRTTSELGFDFGIVNWLKGQRASFDHHRSSLIMHPSYGVDHMGQF